MSDDRERMLRSELPEVKRIAGIILSGAERARECGLYYDRYSSDLVQAMAQRIISMADALEKRRSLAPPGTPADRMNRGARAVVQLLSDGARHTAADLREAICVALGLKGTPHVATYVKHANAYLLDQGQRIAPGAGRRSYRLTDDCEEDGRGQ